ncbi:MAG: Hsp70 family protein [Planctomycetota bacterium]
MALTPEPIYYEKLRRNTGAKRKLIGVRNADDTFEGTVKDILKPEWIELEGVYPGAALKFEKGKSTPLVFNINTSHRFFPKEPVRDEKIKMLLDNPELGETELSIGITIPEIYEIDEPFRGVFAVDFGTTNSCYAHQGSQAEGGGHTKTSDEIPSLLYFYDVSDNVQPKYAIGTEAKFEIMENSGQVYAYVMSIKRRLGMNKNMVILDKLAGLRPDHQQEWHVEQIASFIIRALIQRAEEELDRKVVQNVVATFPPMFSQDRKAAIRRAFKKAFADHNAGDSASAAFLEYNNGRQELSDENLIMVLDEANAAAFNYIYRVMLDEMRKYNGSEIRANLLSYDFGGGTIDISVVSVRITRDKGKIKISTELKGISGEADYGGDIVTLQVFKILKMRSAMAIANQKFAAIEAAKKPVEAEQKKEVDIWSQLASGDNKKEEEEDLWGSKGDEEESAKETVPEVVDPELEGTAYQGDQATYEAACLLIHDYADVVTDATSTGKSVDALVKQHLQNKKEPAGASDVKRATESLLNAIETVLPTQFNSYEDKDPHKEKLAQRLFSELWQEADAVKIRVASSDTLSDGIKSPLKKIANYARTGTGLPEGDVSPLLFNDISLKMDDVNAWIDERITKTVKKAQTLYDSIRESEVHGSGVQPAVGEKPAGTGGSGGGLVIKLGQSAAASGGSGGLSLSLGGGKSGGGKGPEKKGADAEAPLRVLLFGNSSRLPIVRRKFKEVFKNVDDQNLIYDPVNLKSSVARGACEEYMLRKVFGGGLIEYSPEGFLNKLPYSVGVFHRDLEFVGYKGGFCPIFTRGTQVGATVVLDSEKVFLVHKEMRDLAVYADYRDGDELQYVGFFNFNRPMTEAEYEQKTATKLADVKLPEPSGSSFQVHIELLPTREMVLCNLTTKQFYLLQIDPFDVDKHDNPFSGKH